MERKADLIEAMSLEELLMLRTGNAERNERNKTMEEILGEAEEQVGAYVRGLGVGKEGEDVYTTSAFAVLSVGSRRLIWKKV